MADRTTIIDVAKKAGVSKSTVSFILNSHPESKSISKQTRLRVLRAVEDTNYQPNTAARTLATGRTNNIGFLLSSKTVFGLADSTYALMLSGVQQACKIRGYHCLSSTYDLSSIKDFVVPSKLRSRCVDGVVVVGAVEDEVIEFFIDSEIPFFITNSISAPLTDLPSGSGFAIHSDRYKASWLEMFEHLYELGHRHIGYEQVAMEKVNTFLCEITEQFNSRHRDGLVKFAVYEQGRSDDAYLISNEIGSRWLELPDAPTAVAGSAQWCIGFIYGLTKSGGQCPRDVSVVSADDSEKCKWYLPSITAYDNACFANSCKAAEMLIDYVEKKICWAEASEKAGETWRTQGLTVRDSTGPAPK